MDVIDFQSNQQILPVEDRKSVYERVKTVIEDIRTWFTITIGDSPRMLADSATLEGKRSATLE